MPLIVDENGQWQWVAEQIYGPHNPHPKFLEEQRNYALYGNPEIQHEEVGEHNILPTLTSATGGTRPSGASFMDKTAKVLVETLAMLGMGAGAGGFLGAGGAIGGGAGAAGAGAVGDAALAGGVGTDTLAGGAALGGETALGSGLSTGSTATGIGGGATGTGLTAGTTASGIGGGATGTGLAATGAGSLAPGYFAAESLYPVAGGVTAAGAASAAGGSGTDSLSAPGSVFGDLARGIPGVLGALASKDQSDRFRDLAERYMSFGAPSRTRYEASFAPGFTMANDPGYSDALGQTTKEFLHKASVTGNPVDSPNAWMQTLSDVNSKFAFPALQEYRRLNAGTGGLASLTAAAPGMDNSAVNANANIYNALGGAAADIFTPRKSLADLLREARF